MPLIECVPNLSEGRRLDLVDRFAQAVSQIQGVRLLDRSSDPDHNRSVLTFAGSPDSLRQSVVALFEAVVPAIDLRAQRGEHPRIGAVDVVPFVPLGYATMDECVALARATAADVASRFSIPVYLYEEAAISADRRKLEHIRRGQFEGLAEKMRDPRWRPDFGPASPHPTAGATAIGARMPLIAYNVNLATTRLDVAREIAARIRESGGGLPAVKALGLSLPARDIVQVSMNLTDYRRTSMFRAFDAVRQEAARRGVDIVESELIGLVPEAALEGDDVTRLRIRGFSGDRILERRL